MTSKAITGVYSAILTPRLSDDSVDSHSLRRLIDFQLSHNISAFAVNGATGEFPITTPDHLRAALSTIRTVAPEARILCGVGGASTAQVITLAGIAADHHAEALLLPMPYFFPYQQEDLDAFARAVAAATPLPILLYNLPQFTSGLSPETVSRLIAEVRNIIGIKDSSGSLDILAHLTAVAPDACRIVGNDSALCPALAQSLCDGVVSGVACVLPELILRAFSDYTTCEGLLNSFITQLDPFPTPWGLKWIAEARGILTASFSQPVSDHRQMQAADLIYWFRAHKTELTRLPHPL
jgi:4-hydroxy-tetrahydrodipicolinate synthase